ncbi:hypothetical protein V8E55_005307 [Tylopilus felleus]
MTKHKAKADSKSFQQRMVNEAARAVGLIIRKKVAGDHGTVESQVRLWDKAVTELRDQVHLVQWVWMPLGNLCILKFLITADIELKMLGNEPTSSSKHLSLDDNLSAEDTDESNDKTGPQQHGDGEQAHNQAAEADACTEDDDQPQYNDNDNDESTTLKSKKGIFKIPLQNNLSAEHVSKVPLCVGPPGAGKIRAASAQDAPMVQTSIGGTALPKVDDDLKAKCKVTTTKEKAAPRHNAANRDVGAEEETRGQSQQQGPARSGQAT